MKGNVLITGGTGLIGSRLTEILIAEGYTVSYLSRKRGDGKIKKYEWNIPAGTLDDEAIDTADYIINLAGANVFEKKWTKEFKKEILSSRRDSVKLIADKLNSRTNKVKAFVSASAIGYYGADTGDSWINESHGAGKDFLSKVVTEWEKEAVKIQDASIRTVILRIGIVLSDKGGALEKLLNPIRMNAGAVIGSGKQYVSWIHIDDMCQLFLKAIQDSTIKGVYNASAPHPVTNEELTKIVAEAVGKSIYLPNVPSFALKFMLGSEKAEIVLGGNRISSEKIQKAGYKFQYPELKTAIVDLVKK